MSGKEAFQRIMSSLQSLLRFDLLYRSPSLLLTGIGIAVFVSNGVVTSILGKFNHLSPLLHYTLDSLLQVALLFPALIVLVFRPIHTNLTRRRLAEEDLTSERNKFKEILDVMPVGVYIVNGLYQVEYANPTLEDEFGSVRGRTCHEYFHGTQIPCAECPIAETLGGKSFTRVITFKRGGKVFEVFDTPLHNADGTTSKLTMVRDITARTVAEAEVQASRQQLRSLSVHQERVREEERTAVSREIHDELGQVLATVQLGVSSLAEEYHDHRHLIEKVSGMQKLIGGAVRTVQRISTQLRPAILDELGLAEAIEWQVSQFRAETSIACTSDILLQKSDFNSDVATAVFRIFQEALTNVIRHAGATRLGVLLEERNGRIVLVVTDNGCGVSPEQIRGRRSLGITGMQERAYALGGRVRLCRSPQQGTVLIAHIPISQEEKHDRPQQGTGR